MQLVVFGLSVSSSWGNGHATLWRGLIHALADAGHRVIFFERDTPYYAAHRDCHGLPNGELHLYRELAEVRALAVAALRDAEVGMVTSYCPDGLAATELVLESCAPIKAFYDLDTPITLDRLARGQEVPYIGPRGLRDFDLVLSYTGGSALRELRSVLGARHVAPLYGSVDPKLHAPVASAPSYRSDLSYLGTYAAERQMALSELFLAPALSAPERKFVLGGSQYPSDFAWSSNIYYMSHVPPYEHAAFYCSARLNLNVTRAPMAALGYCPSGRLFEAAACGAALISDDWLGLDQFYERGDQLLVAHDRDDVLAALGCDDAQLRKIGARARERTLAEHTIHKRAAQLIELIEAAHRVKGLEADMTQVLEV